MKQPEGFVEEGNEHLVCRLKQSLYGLKQSPRCWNSTLDPCIYTLTEGELLAFMLTISLSQEKL